MQSAKLKKKRETQTSPNPKLATEWNKEICTKDRPYNNDSRRCHSF